MIPPEKWQALFFAYRDGNVYDVVSLGTSVGLTDEETKELGSIIDAVNAADVAAKSASFIVTPQMRSEEDWRATWEADWQATVDAKATAARLRSAI